MISSLTSTRLILYIPVNERVKLLKKRGVKDFAEELAMKLYGRYKYTFNETTKNMILNVVNSYLRMENLSRGYMIWIYGLPLPLAYPDAIAKDTVIEIKPEENLQHATLQVLLYASVLTKVFKRVRPLLISVSHDGESKISGINVYSVLFMNSPIITGAEARIIMVEIIRELAGKSNVLNS
ncbi:hypothetical protein D1867_00160 [Acidianus infernus]|uniref:Uncharacterized protein n=1 Tax=Acidianus infernus TaxID=12915 RepID=A0A6A9Q921_ACIIN|nr:hypothetical protein [Acidianus infernus]MUM63702.1 hypothetical protein [Acidianus infernus]